MASVNELLLAAEAKKKTNPLLDLLQTGISGYQTGQGIREQNVNTAIKLLQKQQIEQEMEQQKQMQDEINEQLGLREQATVSGMRETKEKPIQSFPEHRLKQKISQDEKGRYSRTFETVEPKEITVDSLEKAWAKQYADGEITLEQWEQKKQKSNELPPGLLYTMEKDKQKSAMDVRAKTIPGYDITGEVDLEPNAAVKMRGELAEFNSFENEVKRYTDLIKKYGTSEVSDRKVAGQMKSLAKSLQIKIKSMSKLGVLSQSDIPFLEDPIPGPGVFKTKEKMLGAIGETIQSMRDTIDESLRISGYRKKGVETGGSSVPAVGETFKGKKVISVEELPNG